MPIWVPEAVVRAIHAELMAEHGGLPGPEREGTPSAALARGHCFPDGNERLALAVLDVFLQLNGQELVAGEPDAVLVMRGLAAGDVSEEKLAEWVASNSRGLR